MNTERLVETVRRRFDHDAAKKILREKYEAKMLFAYNGGMWRAGPELLMTIAVCPDENSVILDEYGNPVQINTLELELLAQQRWQEQMNGWLTEFQEFSRQR